MNLRSQTELLPNLIGSSLIIYGKATEKNVITEHSRMLRERPRDSPQVINWSRSIDSGVDMEEYFHVVSNNAYFDIS